MNYIPIEELAKAVGKSRRTIDRYMDSLRVNDPEKFSSLTQTKPGGKRILYSTAFIQMLGIGKNIIEQVVQEIVEETEKPHRKPREKRKVINVDEIQPGHEKDMATMDAIMEVYKTGQYTLLECCSQQNVPFGMFLYWLRTRPEFQEVFKQTEKVHRESFSIYIKELAKDSLKKAVTGYDKALESTTYEEKISPSGQSILVPQERKVQHKHIPPNVNSLIFALTNVNPDDWRAGNAPRPPQKETEQDPFERMTDEELNAYLAEAEKKGYLPSNTKSIQ